jgi:hypothetical protein
MLLSGNIIRDGWDCTPLIAENYGNLSDPWLASGFQSQMRVHHFPIAAGQHRNLEAKFVYGSHDAIHGSVVLAGIAGVEDQPVDGPDLDLKRGGRGHYATWIAVANFSGQQSATKRCAKEQEATVGRVFGQNLSGRLFAEFGPPTSITRRRSTLLADAPYPHTVRPGEPTLFAYFAFFAGPGTPHHTLWTARLQGVITLKKNESTI